MKIVGKLQRPRTPEECARLGALLYEQALACSPYPRPRGFVYKAKTYAEYEAWKKRQTNPWLW